MNALDMREMREYSDIGSVEVGAGTSNSRWNDSCGKSMSFHTGYRPRETPHSNNILQLADCSLDGLHVAFEDQLELVRVDLGSCERGRDAQSVDDVSSNWMS